MTVPPLELQGHLPGPVEAVWSAWTDPAVMERWFCPNPAWPLTAATDVRVGGVWQVAMGPHVVAGRYTTVAPPHRLGFTFRWTSEEAAGPDPVTTHVEVRIEPDGDGSRLVLTHTDLPTEAERDGHAEGWLIQLDRLPAVVAGHPAAG